MLASLVTVGGALAANSSSNPTATHFTAAYFNGEGGFFRCGGTHIALTGPNAFTTDIEVCQISDVSTWPAGTYPIVPLGSIEPTTANWFSDFNGVYAASGWLMVVGHKDGTGTMVIHANY
jgi:hypothetical protein